MSYDWDDNMDHDYTMKELVVVNARVGVSLG